jgi:transcriptional regulator with XRE-family HTH domain
MARRPHRPSPSHADESFGRRLARLRKEQGFTQVELAARVGMIQALISDYERDKLRPYADVAVRLAEALEVSTDVLLGRESAPAPHKPLSRRFLRRLQALESLPKRDQDAILRTIDAFLAARKAR